MTGIVQITNMRKKAAVRMLILKQNKTKTKHASKSFVFACEYSTLEMPSLRLQDSHP